MNAETKIALKPIKSEEDYDAVMDEISKLWDCPPDSAEADLLEVLSILVEDYESKHHAIQPLDPIEAIKYRMEEEDLSQKDLVKYFGSKERVSEVLNRKRPLTLRMIKNLYSGLGISADSLLSA
ncbi:type II toxin-antitoxin system HigA family antitoxin [Persicitalea sp.]|uniref:helix-turn-helix domain-containing protein n=1 Tax=Persicitalea sp. TaxID=3100273 RepID=UPI0035944597